MTREQIHIGDMSHETAIGILKLMLEAMETYDGISPTPERINAVKMAIESLTMSSVTPQEPTIKNNLEVDCIPRIEVIDYLCKHCPDDGECFKDCDEIKYLRQMPSVTPQEPFINKPCISSGVCEHDKNVVIDKIRAEIENEWALKKSPCGSYSCGLRRAIEIIDKYKAESEDK